MPAKVIHFPAGPFTGICGTSSSSLLASREKVRVTCVKCLIKKGWYQLKKESSTRNSGHDSYIDTVYSYMGLNA